MAAPKGNKFWEARSSHGANPKFEHASDLWDACLEYLEWVERNPLHEAKVAQSGGKPKVMNLPKMRAMTITGLCVFLDIDHTTWGDWRENREDLSPVITRVENIIRTQKFEGAAADLLNANIIARDLGLADKAEHSGPNGGPIQTEEVSPLERINSRLARLASASGSEGDTGGSE